MQSLPLPTPVQSHLPNELFGESVVLMEYLYCFKSLYELEDFFPSGVSFGEYCTYSIATNMIVYNDEPSHPILE